MVNQCSFYTGCANSGSLSDAQCLSYAERYCALTCDQCKDGTTNPPIETITGHRTTPKPPKGDPVTRKPPNGMLNMLDELGKGMVFVSYGYSHITSPITFHDTRKMIPRHSLFLRYSC